MTRMPQGYRFDIMQGAERPQIERDGSGATYMPLWSPAAADNMPDAIIVKDADGRQAVYVPMTADDGRILKPVALPPPLHALELRGCTP